MQSFEMLPLCLAPGSDDRYEKECLLRCKSSDRTTHLWNCFCRLYITTELIFIIFTGYLWNLPIFLKWTCFMVKRNEISLKSANRLCEWSIANRWLFLKWVWILCRSCISCLQVSLVLQVYDSFLYKSSFSSFWHMVVDYMLAVVSFLCKDFRNVLWLFCLRDIPVSTWKSEM